METRVGDVVFADGGADGGDVADVLHHSRERDRDDGDDGREDQRAVREVHAAEDGAGPVDRRADPGSFFDGCEIDIVAQDGDDVGDDDAHDDRDDPHHTDAPDVEHDDDDECGERDEPVFLAVRDSGAGQTETDGHDDGTGDDRREVSHDFGRTKGTDDRRKDQIDETGTGDAEAGVRQELGLRHGLIGKAGDGGVTAEEREGRTQECGDFHLRDEVEQQCAETGKEQCRRDIESGDQRNEDRGAKHGKHVLETQDDHSGGAQFGGVVNGLPCFKRRSFGFFFCHKNLSSTKLHTQHKQHTYCVKFYQHRNKTAIFSGVQINWFKSPSSKQEKRHPIGCLFSWCGRRDLNPHELAFTRT